MNPLTNPLSIDPQTHEQIAQALAEDHAEQDVSTLWTIPPELQATALLYSRQEGIFCGGPLFAETYRIFDPTIFTEMFVNEGDRLIPEQKVGLVRGKARTILSSERVSLNLVGRFSGIATLTNRFVQAVQGTRAKICDTRKTMPLWRKWDKYAVRMGGGVNHRTDLEEMVLLKDNHLSLAGGAAIALRLVKQQNLTGIPIEIEVDNLEQLRELLAEGVERILLDNMTLAQMQEAVHMTAGKALLEASGGVRIETVRSIAETGVDFISIGALTHSVPAFDFSLEIHRSNC
jgi:nicotinate-nucleotide pyrophosphorylase (carboxylating)